MIVFGSPVTMSRPRISVVTSSGSCEAEPISSLTSSAVCWPIKSLCSCLQWATIASSCSSPPTRIDSETTIPPERDHRHLAGAAADVEDHAPGGLGDGQPGADRRRHRLLDQIRLAGAGREAGLLDRPLLDPGDAGGNADHHARMGEAVLVNALDEVTQHLLGDVEVGDHTILQRPDGADRPGRAAEHPLGVDADRVDLAAARVDRDHRGLREHDASPTYVDERVRGPEVDRHVAAAEAGQVAKQTHCRGREVLVGWRTDPCGLRRGSLASRRRLDSSGPGIRGRAVAAPAPRAECSEP